jgi:hypothetical protein
MSQPNDAPPKYAADALPTRLINKAILSQNTNHRSSTLNLTCHHKNPRPIPPTTANSNDLATNMPHSTLCMLFSRMRIGVKPLAGLRLEFTPWGVSRACVSPARVSRARVTECGSSSSTPRPQSARRVHSLTCDNLSYHYRTGVMSMIPLSSSCRTSVGASVAFAKTSCTDKLDCFSVSRPVSSACNRIACVSARSIDAKPAKSFA